MDGRTDGGAAGAAQAFLLCIWWLVIGTPGVRQRDCRPRRRTASRSHRQPARRGTAGGVPKHRPSAPGAVGAPLPTTVAVTAVGFAWQRPGPAELPAHRRPDRQDRRLRALALQVQSKAGLGEEGGRGGCALGPRKHACGHAHADTRCTEPRTPPRTHLPSPAVPGQPPGLCWGGGFCPADHPARGLSVPQDQAAPPALSPPGRRLPLSMKWGGLLPPGALAPRPAECNAAGAPQYCLGWSGRAPLPAPGPCRQLPAHWPGGCLSALPAPREGGRRLWGWRGESGWGDGGSGRKDALRGRKGRWAREDGAGGLGGGSRACAWGGLGTWGAAVGWLGGGRGQRGRGQLLLWCGQSLTCRFDVLFSY